jgi:plasmid stabilization system protein ParE
MAKVIWQDTAIDDLARIYEHLATQSQSFDVADRVCDEILTATQERLELMPDSGSLVPEGIKFGAREIYRHSYRIIYVHRGDACYIVRCIHSSRDLAQHLDPDNWPQLPGVGDE